MRVCLGLSVEDLKEIIRDKPSIAKRLVRGVIPETAVRVLEEMQNRGVEIFSSCPTPLPNGECPHHYEAGERTDPNDHWETAQKLGMSREQYEDLIARADSTPIFGMRRVRRAPRSGKSRGGRAGKSR